MFSPQSALDQLLAVRHFRADAYLAAIRESSLVERKSISAPIAFPNSRGSGGTTESKAIADRAGYYAERIARAYPSLRRAEQEASPKLARAISAPTKNETNQDRQHGIENSGRGGVWNRRARHNCDVSAAARASYAALESKRAPSEFFGASAKRIHKSSR